MQKGHNSVHMYWIPTKLGTEMCFNEPFMCTKCQLNCNMRLHLMAEKCKVCEMKKKQRNLLDYISGLADTIFKFGM